VRQGVRLERALHRAQAVGLGKFDPKRLGNGRSSVSLNSHDEKLCQNEGADPGVECTTVTDWRVRFYPAGKKRRR
jgi:hypothetical protein